MEKYVLYFAEIDKSHLPNVGGKGANLGEMTQAGFPVPPGFCVTTWAYRTFTQTSQEMAELLDLLDALPPNQLDAISTFPVEKRLLPFSIHSWNAMVCGEPGKST